MLILFIIILVTLFIFIYMTNKSKKVKKQVRSIQNEISAKKENVVQENRNKVEQPKKKKEKQEQYNFNGQNCSVKYDLYDFENLGYKTKILHDYFAFEKLWIKEPYYSVFFRLLIFLDKDMLFIKDPNGKKLIFNTRDERNEEIASKAYKIVSVSDIILKILKNNKYQILYFEPICAQNIVLSVFIFCISKSNWFNGIKIKDICLIFLEDYPYQEDILYYISLFQKEDSQLNFIFKSYQQAIKDCYKRPYAEIIKEEDTIFIPKLSQKIPRDIPT